MQKLKGAGGSFLIPEVPPPVFKPLPLTTQLLATSPVSPPTPRQPDVWRRKAEDHGDTSRGDFRARSHCRTSVEDLAPHKPRTVSAAGAPAAMFTLR